MRLRILLALTLFLVSCKFSSDSGVPANTSDTTPPIAVYPDHADETEAALPEEQDPDYGKNQVLLETDADGAKYIIGNGYDLRKAKMSVYSPPSLGGSFREITADEAVLLKNDNADYWGDFAFDCCIVTKSDGESVFDSIEEYENSMPLKNVLYNGRILRIGDKINGLSVKNIETALRGANGENAKQRYRIDFEGQIILEGYARLGFPSTAHSETSEPENVIFTPTSESYGELPIIMPFFNKTIRLDNGKILNTDVPDFNLGTLTDLSVKSPHLKEYLNKDVAVKVMYSIKNPTIQYGTGDYPSYAEFAGEIME